VSTWLDWYFYVLGSMRFEIAAALLLSVPSSLIGWLLAEIDRGYHRRNWTRR
jgi:hypothetical protein